MHTYYDAKEMLHKELNDIVQKGELSAGSLETIDKLLNAIKNADKIIMYEKYDDGDYSRNDGRYAYADRKRDSMGRYSRTDYRGGIRGQYSYADDEHDAKMSILNQMMNEATNEDERRTIRKVMRRMEEQ